MYTATSPTDSPTFEEYAGAAWPSLYRYAYLLSGNHADAEDIAQQTLLKAYRSWSRVKGSDSPTAYLRQMLTNTFLSHKRPKGRRLELLTDAPPELTHAPAGGPEERMVLWPHVKSLPPRQRAVIVLRYYEDLSEQEIANTLGCSRGNVKSTAHHALKALRAALGSDDTDGRGN
jgi:RNA polymerase sigma-70 factor (sigma-E family)